MTILIVSQILSWAAIGLLALLVVALARQIGTLQERVAPAGALAINQKLAPRDPAPVMTLTSLTGASIGVGGQRDRAQLLFFLSPDCPICGNLLPALKSAVRAEADWLDLVLLSDGGAESEHRRYVISKGIADVPYALSEQAGRSFGVGRLPYAVLIDADGKLVSFGIVNTREHLDSLFEAKRRGVANIQEFIGHKQAAQMRTGA